ncbi:hypothetical protein DFQ27_004766 [Actinomortierella ambigua]|uniref:Uncharacterized protein n=1 Tax=Actinomortierella ambigua TaxID=1343610 RepID=A0A9P6Q286_9FUNG|nr:hypothetical protein DFQ27_004766 [Actinomortierella ambigua]
MLLSKSLFLLCSAVVVMARQSTNAVASGAIFVGVDTTNPDATPVEIFENPKNHAAAASSVVTFSAMETGFNPSLEPAKSLEGPFRSFLTKASTFPGFLLEMNNQKTLSLTGSLIQLEEMVREAVSMNGGLVGRGIRDLVQGLIPDESMTNWILSLVVFDKPKGSDAVKIQLVHLTLKIETDDDNNAVIPKQDAKINSSVLSVNGEFLVKYAETLSSKIRITLVRDTIDFLTSPKEITPAEYVFSTACDRMF